MPSLGFASTLAMTIQLQRYDPTRPRPTRRSRAPTATRDGDRRARLPTGVQQGGAVFPFAADPGKVDATVTFTWTRGSQTLGST